MQVKKNWTYFKEISERFTYSDQNIMEHKHAKFCSEQENGGRMCSFFASEIAVHRWIGMSMACTEAFLLLWPL